MSKVLLALLLVVNLIMLSSCDRLPNWLKLGGSRSQEQQLESGEIVGTILFSVNGRTITLEEFNRRIEAYNSEIEVAKDIPESVKSTYLIKDAADKKRLLDGMVERELVIAEALDRGMDQDAELLKSMKALKEELLFVKLVEAEKEKVKVGSREIENYYNQRKDAFKIPEERRVSMIMLPSETRAKEILIQLLQGTDFANLARDNSTDKSANAGGDINFIVQKQPVPQPDKKTMFKKFEEIAFSLELNKPSTVFKGPGGFYIIKITEIKDSRQLLLSEVYQTINDGLQLQKQEQTLQKLIDNLRKSGNIIVHSELVE